MRYPTGCSVSEIYGQGKKVSDTAQRVKPVPSSRNLLLLQKEGVTRSKDSAGDGTQKERQRR